MNKLKQKLLVALPALTTLIPFTVHAENGDMTFEDFATMLNQPIYNEVYNQAANNGYADAVVTLYDWGMQILQWVYILALILSMIALAITIIQYIRSGTNPREREEAKNNAMWSFIVLACLGAMPLIYVIIVRLLNIL